MHNIKKWQSKSIWFCSGTIYYYFFINGILMCNKWPFTVFLKKFKVCVKNIYNNE